MAGPSGAEKEGWWGCFLGDGNDGCRGCSLEDDEAIPIAPSVRGGLAAGVRYVHTSCKFTQHIHLQNE